MAALCRGTVALPAALRRAGGPLLRWRGPAPSPWRGAAPWRWPTGRWYSTAAPSPPPEAAAATAAAASTADAAGDSEEPFMYEVGDEIYALAGSDGLYYPCIIQDVDTPGRQCRVVFSTLPEGEQVERVIPFSSVNRLEGDGLISTFMNNFIISEAETRRIPTENWAYASEMAWRALFTATMCTLFGFVFLAYVVYRLYIRDDPDWHLKLSKWAKGKFGVPPRERDPSKSIPISWAELLLMVRDGEPPERVKLLIAERETAGPDGAVFDPMDPLSPTPPAPSAT